MSSMLSAALQYARMKGVPDHVTKEAKDHHEVYQAVDQWLKKQKEQLYKKKRADRLHGK